MSSTVLYVSVSLDGYIVGPNKRPDNGLGDSGERFHEWPFEGQVVDEFMAIGALVRGPRDHRAGRRLGRRPRRALPIFVLSRREPAAEIAKWPLVTYVDDVTTAMTEAKRAAGGRKVLVHGAGTAQLALATGVLDEPRST